MNIAIVNTLPIPSGQASVNRILSLGKGLVEHGDNVTILSSGKGDNTEEHVINGIKYRNFGTKGKSIKSLFGALLKILQYISSNSRSIDVVWIESNSPLLILPLYILCKSHGIRFIMEKSEFPFVLMKKGGLAKIWSKIYVNTLYKCFDGMIIMTEPLLQYFKPLVRKRCKLIKCPMTVDMSRFEDVSVDNEYGNYAAYCGNMSGNKDGVENLIEAFSYVEKIHPDFKLVMVGGTDSEQEFSRIKDKVKNLGLRNVIFTGGIERDAIPGILTNAKILCLARPSSLQSTGGFPTKLGEYLSTGHPVVVTAVGDIPSYLDRTNSFIVEPDNNKLFGEAMNEILEDYEKASMIGLKGREVAMSNFNYKVQGDRLHQFMIEFKNK